MRAQWAHRPTACAPGRCQPQAWRQAEGTASGSITPAQPHPGQGGRPGPRPAARCPRCAAQPATGQAGERRSGVEARRGRQRRLALPRVAPRVGPSGSFHLRCASCCNWRRSSRSSPSPQCSSTAALCCEAPEAAPGSVADVCASWLRFMRCGACQQPAFGEGCARALQVLAMLRKFVCSTMSLQEGLAGPASCKLLEHGPMQNTSLELGRRSGRPAMLAVLLECVCSLWRPSQGQLPPVQLPPSSSGLVGSAGDRGRASDTGHLRIAAGGQPSGAAKALGRRRRRSIGSASWQRQQRVWVNLSCAGSMFHIVWDNALRFAGNPA